MVWKLFPIFLVGRMILEVVLQEYCMMRDPLSYSDSVNAIPVTAKA